MMRKIFFLVTCMFLISLVSAAANQCTPESGYSNCWESTDTYGTATAHAKSQVSSIQGVQKGGYYVGNTWIDFKFEGDRYYVYTNLAPGELENRCNVGGCTLSKGTTTGQSGMWFLTESTGESYTDCPMFVAWDCTGDCGNYNSPDYWVVTSVGAGWDGDNCFDIKQVECYDDSDCPHTQYCDKSGSWETWNCKVEDVQECLIPSDCEGKSHEDVPGYWDCQNENCVWVEEGEEPPPEPDSNFLIIGLGIAIIGGGLFLIARKLKWF